MLRTCWWCKYTMYFFWKIKVWKRSISGIFFKLNLSWERDEKLCFLCLFFKNKSFQKDLYLFEKIKFLKKLGNFLKPESFLRKRWKTLFLMSFFQNKIVSYNYYVISFLLYFVDYKNVFKLIIFAGYLKRSIWFSICSKWQ